MLITTQVEMGPKEKMTLKDTHRKPGHALSKQEQSSKMHTEGLSLKNRQT